MRVVFALVLLIGLALAGFAVYVAQNRFAQYQTKLEDQQRSLAKNIKLTKLWVVTHKVRYGEKLHKKDVTLVAWPVASVPEGAFQEKNKPYSKDDSKLRSVLRTMEKNEPVLAVKVTAPGEDAGVTSRLSKGMRAFAIRVDVASGVSGFLRPGESIDIYWSGQANAREITKMILAGVKLIAIDQTADQDVSNPIVARTVTVEVSPQDVGALAQAQSTGKLSLSLRGAKDNSAVAAVEIDQNQLLGIKPEAPKVVEAKRECTIRTRKGSEVVTIPVPCPNGG